MKCLNNINNPRIAHCTPNDPHISFVFVSFSAWFLYKWSFFVLLPPSVSNTLHTSLHLQTQSDLQSMNRTSPVCSMTSWVWGLMCFWNTSSELCGVIYQRSVSALGCGVTGWRNRLNKSDRVEMKCCLFTLTVTNNAVRVQSAPPTSVP